MEHVYTSFPCLTTSVLLKQIDRDLLKLKQPYAHEQL